jgi:hypothetical protein
MKNIQTNVIVTIICIIVTFGTTYFVTGAIKDQERLDIIAEHESELSNLNEKIDKLENEIDILEEYISYPIDIPSILFRKESVEKTITVVSVSPPNVRWSDINIQGNCNIGNFGTYVVAGDNITDCSGSMTIKHIPSDALLGVYTFY